MIQHLIWCPLLVRIERERGYVVSLCINSTSFDETVLLTKTIWYLQCNATILMGCGGSYLLGLEEELDNSFLFYLTLGGSAEGVCFIVIDIN